MSEEVKVIEDLFRRVENRMNSHVKPKIHFTFEVTEEQYTSIERDMAIFEKMKIDNEKVTSVSERYIFSHTGIGAALDVEFTLVTEEGKVLVLKLDYSDYENW